MLVFYYRITRLATTERSAICYSGQQKKNIINMFVLNISSSKLLEMLYSIETGERKIIFSFEYIRLEDEKPLAVYILLDESRANAADEMPHSPDNLFCIPPTKTMHTHTIIVINRQPSPPPLRQQFTLLASKEKAPKKRYRQSYIDARLR